MPASMPTPTLSLPARSLPALLRPASPGRSAAAHPARRLVGLAARFSLPLARRLRWHTIWVVNAGSQQDVDAYFPPSVSARLREDSPLLPIGVYTAPGARPSLIVGTLWTNAELAARPAALAAMVGQLAGFRARRICLNGVIPSLLHRHQLWPDDERFIQEQRGTLFMLEENVSQVAERLRDRGERLGGICVVGAGFTGAQLANRLAGEGYTVTTLDPRADVQRRLDPQVRHCGMDARSALQDAQLAILLSTRGDDGVRSLLGALRPGMVVLSDTHPKVSLPMAERLAARGVTLVESAMTRPGVRFYPKLPRWASDTVPGCVGQAFVEADDRYDPRRSFDDNARDILTARLDRPAA